MNAVCRILSCLAVALVSVAQAAVGDIDLLEDSQVECIPDLQAAEPTGFWGRMHTAFDRRADEVFADRLHPLKLMKFNFTQPDDSWEQALKRIDYRAQRGLLKSLEYSLRDAALGLPLMGWLETRADALGDFLVDSVDSVEEESVSPFDLAYGHVERAWWKSLAGKRSYRYGLRPFGTSPYAYFAMSFKEAGRVLLLGNIRYYLQNFSDHRFEISLSFPLPGGVAFDLGTFYQFGAHEVERRLVAKLFKPLKFGGIAHLGVEVQKDPVVFAGVSLPL